jgi:hypothetical protein
MSDDTSDLPRAPSVSVVGLGATGAETLDAITTAASATLTTVDGPDDAESRDDAVADADFLYLAGDVSEAGVVAAAETLLDAAEGHTSFVVEGTTDRPGPLVEGCDFLLPVDPDAVPTPDGRAFVASAIADCFESMLPATGLELGYGEWLVTTGSGRIGALHVQALGGLRHAVTDRFDPSDPDAVLYFLCNDERFDPAFVERRWLSVTDEFSDTASLIRDRRIHDRYGDPAHAKLIAAVDADADRRARLLRP